MSNLWPGYEHTPSPPCSASVGTVHVHSLSWAVQDYETWWPKKGPMLYGSFTGKYPMLKAFWAGFNDGSKERVSLTYRQSTSSSDRSVASKRLPGSDVYFTFWNQQPLQMAGTYAHLLIAHRSALQPAPGQDFLHLSPDNLGADLGHFYRQLDAVLALPLVEAWTPQLWDVGLSKKLIVPVATHNAKAWWITSNEIRWARVVTAITTGNPDAPLRMETIGKAARGEADTDFVIPDEEGSDE